MSEKRIVKVELVDLCDRDEKMSQFVLTDKSPEYIQAKYDEIAHKWTETQNNDVELDFNYGDILDVLTEAIGERVFLEDYSIQL